MLPFTINCFFNRKDKITRSPYYYKKKHIMIDIWVDLTQNTHQAVPKISLTEISTTSSMFCKFCVTDKALCCKPVPVITGKKC